MKHIAAAGNLQVEVSNDGFYMTSLKGEELLSAKEPLLFYPKFWQGGCEACSTAITSEDNRVTIRYEVEEGQPLKWGETVFEAKGRYVMAYCRFAAAKDVILNEIDLFPADTLAPLHKAVNFRNRHCTEQTYPDLAMGEEFSTTTYSTDWQFAPHPSMMLFAKGEDHLFVGALDLPESFGLYLDVDGYRLKRFAESYGGGENGLKISAGNIFAGPKYAIFLDHQKDPHKVIGRYTDILVQEKYIPDPGKRQRFSWHRDNLYCTWIDQGYLTDTVIPNALHEQIEITLNAANALNEELVRDAAAIIKREKLHFKTILIDMGWSERGEWIADKSRFPDFRGLVDELHKDGFKVVVWWNWAEVAPGAQLPEKYLMGGGRLNKHGQRMIDFSNPVTQEEYFKPLFRRLFSNEDGCYDVDGVKTDFLSDKIHPDMEIYDQDWRGEEKYFYKMFEMFFREMRIYKEDTVHIGCAGHPYLAEFIDINRTYDVWSTNVLEHVNRGRMLRACSPGTPVAYDFHHFQENLEEYFKKAYENDCSVQIGNLMGIKTHPVGGWIAADDGYFDCLRLNLNQLPR